MNKSLWLAGDVLLIAFFWLFPHLGLLPIYAYPPVLLAVCWLWLRVQGKSFATMGFKWNQVPARAFWVGTLAAVVYFVVYYFVLGPFFARYLQVPRANVSDFYFVRSSFARYLTILVIAWLLAIPFEELIFRGFIFYKLLQWTGKNFWLSGFMASVLFGAYHLQQGMGGVVHAFVFAVAATALYKYVKGNLWYLIFFHAVYDTIAITAVRMGVF
jgi:membrane protease YdiL (CAAX protease family)